MACCIELWEVTGQYWSQRLPLLLVSYGDTNLAMQPIRVKLLFVVDADNPSHYIIKILSTFFASELSNSCTVELVHKN